jgi:glutamyl-tRNA synthetase
VGDAKVQRCIQRLEACGLIRGAKGTGKAHGAQPHFTHHRAARPQLPLLHSLSLPWLYNRRPAGYRTTIMSTIVRFAPSPTGRIHIGNARTAILNWLLARKTGGQFILRYDDTDTARSTEEYARGIAADLEWLGISPARVEWQSKRFARYDAVADDLRARGFLYPCYETADELDRRRKRQQARGLPPVYDRAALKLSEDEKRAFEAEGRKPHWRFKLAQKVVEWTDLIRGAVHIDTANLSDPVLIREDGTYLYTLPSVIDDVDFAVTHVIRGEDHVVNTAVQIEITKAMGGAVPAYAHHSLLTGADGKGLSKRLGSLSIGQMREDGFEAMAVVSHAALLGTSDNIHPCTDYRRTGGRLRPAQALPRTRPLSTRRS